MDNKPQLISNQATIQQQHPIVLSEKEIEIARRLYHYNQLISYPLSATQLEDWSRSLNELKPDLKLDDLKRAIDLMKTGEVKIDLRLGIQNIFEALDYLETGGSYFVAP